MKYRILIPVLLLFFSHVYSDVIYSIHGFVYHNVKVIKTTTTTSGLLLNYQYYDSIKARIINRSLPIEEVLKFEHSDFDSTRGMIIETLFKTSLPDSSVKSSIGKRQIYNNPFSVYKTEYPNRYFLIVSAISIGLTWDFISRSDNIQKQIDINNDLAKKINIKIDNSGLESEKTRTIVIGVICAASTIASLIYSFQSVEIKTDGKSLSMSYKF